jgi:glycoside hydrolase-like protein
MHRAVVVMIVSGYALSGTVLGTGHHLDAASRKPAVAAERPMAGFDTCRTPSLHTMKIWRAKFSAVGIYIGGEDMACAHGHLSRTWVRTVQAMGWSLLPNYVGPQPPCDPYRGRIHVGQAAAQGRAAANSAIADAGRLGIGRGSPLYYDMEAYNRSKDRCATAVLAFLDAWTRRLNARGYLSGVYSSADAAIISLRSDTWIHGHRLAKPQCVWIALWDNRRNVNTPGYVPLSLWPPGDRSKQYSGPHWAKVGGIKLDIDFDLVDGPVARGYATAGPRPAHRRGNRPGGGRWRRPARQSRRRSDAGRPTGG